MKTKVLLSASLLIVSVICVNAQLEVKTSGNVEMSKSLEVAEDVEIGEDLTVTGDVVVGNNLSVTQNVTFSKNLSVAKDMALGTASVDNHVGLNIYKTTTGTTTPYYGVKSYLKMWSSMPTSPLYGVCGFVDASEVSTMVTQYPLVGVFGQALKLSSYPTVFAAGIVGVASYYGGIGVYGKANYAGSLPTSMPSGSYAGYFDGNVSVIGYVSAYNISLQTNLNRSESVQTLSSSIANNIYALKPVSYTHKQDSAWTYDVNSKELRGLHYGLMAEDVQKVLPEIVYDHDGDLSINYIELIPLLIKEIQELSKEVETLKARIDDGE